MPPYRARMGGIAGSGVYDRGSNAPDYGAIIDAMVGGASSLIRQSYLRKQAQRQMKQEDEDRRIQDEDRAYQRSRDAKEDARNATADEHKRKIDEAKLISEGYHEDEHATTLPTSAISAAMSPTGIPTLPDSKIVTQPQGPHFDLERSVPYRTAVDRTAATARASAERQERTIQARVEAQARGEEIQKRLIRLRAEEARRTRASSGGRIAGAMTEGQRRQFAQEDAEGLLETFGGTATGAFEAAVDFLESPEGAPYRESGVTVALLANARARRTNRTTSAALPFVREFNMPSDSAVGAVEDVRKAAGGGDAPKGRLRAPAKAEPARRDSATTKRRPLNDREKARAKTDEGFAAFLKTKGYSDLDWK